MLPPSIPHLLACLIPLVALLSNPAFGQPPQLPELPPPLPGLVQEVAGGDTRGSWWYDDTWAETECMEYVDKLTKNPTYAQPPDAYEKDMLQFCAMKQLQKNAWDNMVREDPDLTGTKANMELKRTWLFQSGLAAGTTDLFELEELAEDISPLVKPPQKNIAISVAAVNVADFQFRPQSKQMFLSLSLLVAWSDQRITGIPDAIVSRLKTVKPSDRFLLKVRPDVVWRPTFGFTSGTMPWLVPDYDSGNVYQQESLRPRDRAQLALSEGHVKAAFTYTLTTYDWTEEEDGTFVWEFSILPGPEEVVDMKFFINNAAARAAGDKTTSGMSLSSAQPIFDRLWELDTTSKDAVKVGESERQYIIEDGIGVAGDSRPVSSLRIAVRMKYLGDGDSRSSEPLVGSVALSTKNQHYLPVILAVVLSILAPCFGAFKLQVGVRIIALLVLLWTYVHALDAHEQQPGMEPLMDSGLKDSLIRLCTFCLITSVLSLLLSLILWAMSDSHRRRAVSIPPPHTGVMVGNVAHKVCPCFLSTAPTDVEVVKSAPPDQDHVSQWAMIYDVINVVSFWVIGLVYMIGILVICL